MDRIGDRLRSIREGRGLIRKAAAAAIGVADSTLQRWEQGTAEIGVLSALQLARLYETTLPDLVGEPAREGLSSADANDLLQFVLGQVCAIDALRARATAGLRRALTPPAAHHPRRAARARDRSGSCPE